MLHLSLLAIIGSFYNEDKLRFIASEIMLILSLLVFIWLIRKMLQPLECIDTFASTLAEQEYTTRFHKLNQTDLDKLVEQFNTMLRTLHQKRLEMGEQQGILEKLMDESPVGVLILDYDGYISDINPAAESIMTISFSEITKKKIEHINSEIFNLLKAIPVNIEQLVITSNGRRLKIGHYSLCDRGFKRSFYLIQELTGDIVQSQKHTYEKLIRVMCHEVSNTIGASNSLLETCLTFKNKLDPNIKTDFEQAINIAISRCENLNQFMQAYANIVKIPKPLKTDYNLSQQLSNLAYLYQGRCKEQGINIISHIDNGIHIIADTHLMEQALVNIIQNAIESINNGGEIIIHLSRTIENIILQIKDSGSGLDDEVQKEIFSPFFTTKNTGQGIGLMLVSEILNLHNFKYKLSNNTAKPGAYFEISI